jgi:hypothetical protein
MAEQGYVLDIDAKFLANLKKADESLAKTAKQVENLTKSFEETLTRSSAFAIQMQRVYSELAIIGGADFSSGMAKVDTTARNAVDAVNLLTRNITKLKQEYNELASDWTGNKAKGTHLRITSDADMENVAKLKQAIKQINDTLNNKKRKKPLSLVDVESLVRQKDLYKRAVAELLSTDEKRTRAVVSEANKRIKEIKREAQITKEMTEAKYTATPKAAMSYATQAKSIGEMSKALKYLETVRDSINTKTKSGAKNVIKINTLIAELNDKVKNLKRKVSLVGDEMDTTKNAASRFSSIMKGALSIQAIRGYINQLISVRGEMELQQRSLQAILKDKGEANKVWKQTIDLAVKSPFQIKEMVTYTKQLAAYRVESEKLVETNKMLADISAGLGVDMSRLILAYGQVKAANYLRGTELRQFSEAGINILDELAEHFSTLEGTTVSVGEVFERVTKRMVSFEDVETVLKKVTSASGTFYRMQEIQSETLRGQISNLKDSITVMFNDIGKANDGVMKTGVAFARTLVEHWEEVAFTLKSVLAVMTVVKINSMLASRNLIALALKMKVITGDIPKILTLGQGLTAIFKKAASSITKAASSIMKFAAANPWLLLITAAIAGITSAVVEFIKQSDKLDSIREKYKELNNTIRDLSISFRQGFDKGNLDAAKKELDALIDVANTDYKLNIDAQIPDNIDLAGLESQFVSIREQIFDAKEFAKEVEVEFAKRDGFFSNLFIGSGRDPIEQVKKFGEEAERIFTSLRSETKDVAYAIQSSGIELTSEQMEALNTILKPMGSEQTKIAYIEGINNAYEELKDVIESTGIEVEDFNKILLLTKRVGIDTATIFDKLEDDIKWWWDDDRKARNIKFGIDQLALEKELSETETQILYWAANERFEINITPTFSASDGVPAFAAWQKTYNEMVENVKGFQKITNPEKTREDLISDLTAILNENQETLDAIKNIGAEKATGEGGAYEGVDTKELELKVSKADELLNWLRGSVDNTNNQLVKSQKDWVNEVIKSVRDAHKEYVSLLDDLDAVGSKTLALERTQDIFNEAIKHIKDFDGISLGNIKFETEQGAIDALTMLKNKLPESAHESRLAIEKAIGDIRGELTISESKDSMQKLQSEIESLFTGYELSIELGDLNIPKDWAASMFDIKAFDLSDIRTKILEEVSKVEAGGGEKNKLKMLNEFLHKVDELEQKAQQARLKKYLAYARDAIGDRAKIKIEELKKLQEIELTFAKDSPEKERAISKVREDSIQSLNKQKWEEFQKSSTFVSLFEDLDSASQALTEHAIQKLQEFQLQWQDMPYEEMRDIVDKISKLREHLASMSPFGDGFKDVKDRVLSDGRTYADIELENVGFEQEIELSQEYISELETIIRLREEGNTEAEFTASLELQNIDIIGMETDELRNALAAEKNKISLAKKNLANNKASLEDQKLLKAYYLSQAEAIQNAQKLANDLYDAFSDIMDVLGQGDGMGAVFAQMGMDMANSVMNCFALQLQLKAVTVEAHTFEEAMNKAMGVIGWIVMGVQLIGTALKAAFDAHDMRIDKQIQQLAKNVEYLQGRFEEFEKALDKAYSTTQVESFTKALSDNIDRQIANYERMRKLEEDKKKTDQSKIDEYNDAIKDLSEQRKEIFEEQQSNVTAGILDDALSAAEGFVDAWYEAFKETGDGLSGLRENFKEMLTDLIKKQAAMQIVGHYTKMYSDWLAGYIDVAGGDAMLTADEAKEWATKVKETMPELNAMLENFFSGTQELLQEEGSLSELSKGIQGVTESTAQVLEALLNSMRFYVADSNTQLKAIAASFASNDVERNPLLNELRQQTALIRSIESMFDSVIGRGSGPHSGAYLKVLM